MADAGWTAWAENIRAASGADGVALYCPKSGGIWGKAGEFCCGGQLNSFDLKADGKDAPVPLVNNEKFMLIRKTLDDEPLAIFKCLQDNVVTMKGPGESRVAMFIKGKKPETAMNSAVSYLKSANAY